MSALSWRATFWFCFAFALFIFSFLFLFFPETYRIHEKFDLELPSVKDSTSTLNSNDTPKQEVEKNEVMDRSDEKTVTPLPTVRRMNPFAAFILLKHPFIFLSAATSGIAFGCMFAVETIIPELYEKHYGLNSWQTGKRHSMTFFFFLT